MTGKRQTAVSGPTLNLETEIQRTDGPHHIAGLDEAGRGAIAGPVFAAAVILPLDQPKKLARLAQVNDSKQLTAVQREKLFEIIIANALTYGVGSSSAAEIDEMGILPANAQAMQRALARLDPPAAYLLIDGRMRLKSIALPQRSIIRGDSLSLSIAAASILAKVSRDRHMVELEGRYPHYGFAQHKGYGTRQHIAALEKQGPCPIHRYSFAPIRKPMI